jgi:hypothetical protein
MKAESPKHVRRPLDTLSRPRLWLKYRVLLPLKEVCDTIRYGRLTPSCSEDAIVSGIDNHINSIAALLERGDIESFLRRLAELTFKLLYGPLWGRALFIPQLDELTRRASLMITPVWNLPKSSKILVYVATAVYSIGGHTRLIEDIAAALPEYRHLLVITTMEKPDPSELAILKPRFDELGLDIYLLKTLSWAEKASELSSLIALLGPQAVILLASPHDSIANVGVAGHAAPRVLLLHQADHVPSLGASRVDYAHVDVTPACHAVCASHPHLNASLLNLTVQDKGTVPLVGRRRMIGVTCGRAAKYEGASEFSYAELIAALFAAGVDKMFHIGDMPLTQKDRIFADIAATGQDPQRLIFLPNTPSLASKLIEVSPNFYLVSHPVVGAKSTIEAMSVGLPILFAHPPNASGLLSVDMTFGTSVEVSDLGQIPIAVRHIETEKGKLATRSREIYERHYSPAVFREGLLSAIASDAAVELKSSAK